MSYKLSIKDAIEWFERLAEAVEVDNLKERAEKLSKLFEDITASKRLKEIKAGFDEGLYPQLPAASNFDREGMVELVMDDGSLTKEIEHLLVNNPLAQLLYSVAWKNGDLRKFKPLKYGLTDEGGRNIRNIENDSYVYYQYGKHIIDRGEPIVDKHTGRAFKFINILKENKKSLEEKDIEKIRSYGKLNRTDYLNYLEWVNKVLPSNLVDREHVLSCFDKIMFTLGKALSIKASR